MRFRTPLSFGFAASILLLAATEASAICLGCTGRGSGFGYTAEAPFGNFSLDYARGSDKYDVDMVYEEDIVFAPKPLRRHSDGWVFPQSGMTYKAHACEYGNIDKPGSVPDWKGECKSTTLTVICYENFGETQASCKPIMDAYLKKNPLTAQQKIYGGRIQTCLPFKDTPEPEPEVSADSSGIEYDMTIKKPTIPTYSRDGSNLRKSHDDFVGKR